MRSPSTTVSLLTIVFTACAHDAPARADNTADATQVTYPANPDPLPPIVLTGENIVCPQDVCVLKQPPLPVVIALRDGAIIGGQSDVIVRVGLDGRKRFTYGGLGDGPGEYHMVGAANVDSAGMLTVMDVRMSPRRIQYDSTGKVLSTVAVKQTDGEAFVSMYVGGHDVYFLTTHNPLSPADSNNATLSKLSADGRELKPVLRVHCSQPTNGWGFPLSFVWRFPVIAVDDRGAIYSAQPDAYMIRRSAIDGAPSFRLAMDVAPEPVTAKEIEDYRGSKRSPAGGSSKIAMQVNSAFQQQLEAAAANAPKVYPVLSAITVLSDQSIWIRRFAKKDADSARWDAFKADGKPIGSITLASIAQIRAGTASRVLMVDKDSLDVPVIRWYTVSTSTK